jgi:hypothetical protein
MFSALKIDVLFSAEKEDAELTQRQIDNQLFKIISCFAFSWHFECNKAIKRPERDFRATLLISLFIIQHSLPELRSRRQACSLFIIGCSCLLAFVVRHWQIGFWFLIFGSWFFSFFLHQFTIPSPSRVIQKRHRSAAGKGAPGAVGYAKPPQPRPVIFR